MYGPDFLEFSLGLFSGLSGSHGNALLPLEALTVDLKV